MGRSSAIARIDDIPVHRQLASAPAPRSPLRRPRRRGGRLPVRRGRKFGRAEKLTALDRADVRLFAPMSKSTTHT